MLAREVKERARASWNEMVRMASPRPEEIKTFDRGKTTRAAAIEGRKKPSPFGAE